LLVSITNCFVLSKSIGQGKIADIIILILEKLCVINSRY
jgi:hypothetical protein